ncbi:MAG: ABC transporter permease, partial [Thermoprotei archaeon]
AIVRKALEVLMENRTTIIIAHRLTLARSADRIIVLENGQIVEIGNHMELMEKKNVYYKLYVAQMGLEKTVKA